VTLPDNVQTIVLKDVVNPSEACLSEGGSLLISTFINDSISFVARSLSIVPSLGCVGLCASCFNEAKDYCTAC